MPVQSVLGFWRIGPAFLAVIVTAGCEDSDSDTSNDPVEMDASTLDAGDASKSDAGPLDAGPHDGSMDAKVDAAQLDATKTCYSPLDAPDGGKGQLSQITGCDCQPTSATSYCVHSLAVVCYESSSSWAFGLDGYCAPTLQPDRIGSCQQLKGTLIPNGSVCPSGFATRRGYRREPADAGPGEYDDCCYPIDVTAQNCTQAGLSVLATSSQGNALTTTCSNGGALRAFVVGQSTASLCCAVP